MNCRVENNCFRMVKLFFYSFIAFLLFPFQTSAQVSDSVNVTAVVLPGVYYEIDPPDSSSCEIGQEEQFDIYVYHNTDPEIPIADLDIELTISNRASNTSYSDDGTTDSDGEETIPLTAYEEGTYDMEVVDTSDTYDLLPRSDYWHVWPALNIPVMDEMPEYVNEANANAYWSYLARCAGQGYEFFLEISTDAYFTQIVEQYTWHSDYEYHFGHLDDGIRYYFRVKARNDATSLESGWSNIVSTILDKTPPVIVIEDVVVEADDDDSFFVTIPLDITDNVGVRDVIAYCVSQTGGAPYECGTISLVNGDYVLVIDSDLLEQDISGEFFDEYQFCIQATDFAGNGSVECGVPFDVPEQYEDLEPPPEEFINVIRNIIDDIIEEIVIFFDEVFANFSVDFLAGLALFLSILAIALGLWLKNIQFRNLFYMLFQIFSNILAWLGLRIKEKPYGYVYDSVTKDPVSQAVVRAYDAENNRLVSTDVTDEYGVFSLRLDEGVYKFIVKCKDYIYPSQVIIGNSDYPRKNVYHGEILELKKQTEPNMAIPVDPVNPHESKMRKAAFRNRLGLAIKILAPVITVAGFSLSLYLYFRAPNWITLLIVLSYIPAFIMDIITMMHKPVRFGAIKDLQGVLRPGIILGLRELEFDRLVSKRVTDSRGLYRFIVPPGKYKVDILTPQYIPGQGEQDYMFTVESEKKDEPGVIAKDLVVEKAKK